MTAAATMPAEAFAFLADLARNNDRAWFTPRKLEYEASVLAPMRAMAAALATSLAARDVPLTCDPLKAVFRVHRDVRFSRDKSPYKTHAGAVLSRGGGKSTNGVLYLHVQPGGSFAACGFYQPSPADLSALRTAMVARPERLAKLLEALHAAGLDLSRTDALTRAPRGFEQVAEPIASVLRLRHLIVSRTLSEADLAEAAVVDTITEFVLACRPLLAFGWAALP